MISVILVGISILYFLTGITAATLLLFHRSAATGSGKTRPLLKMLIVARNEQDNLPDLFASIRAMDKTACNFELIIVNDHSTDKTAEMLQEFANANSFAQTKTFDACRGKVANLRRLISEAVHSGDIFILTDADCVFPRKYLNALLAHFPKKGGVLAGPVIPRHQCPLQYLDWLLLSAAGSASSILGQPLSAFGNNLAIAGDTLRAIGYEETIHDQAPEDTQLVMAVSRSGYPVRLPLDPDLTVETECVTRPTYFRQKVRWSRAIMIIPALGRATMLLFAIANLLVLPALLAPPAGWLLALSVTAANVWLLSVAALRISRPLPFLAALIYPLHITIVFLVLMLGRKSLASDWEEPAP